jgi:hypothetical protein
MAAPCRRITGTAAMMKRLAAASLFLALSCLGAFASTCNVTEFLLYAPGGVQVADLDSLVTDQSPITTSGTTAQSAAFSGDTKMIQISCDTQSAMAYGSNPTATTSNMTIPAGSFIYFKVTGGKKVAFILRP